MKLRRFPFAARILPIFLGLLLLPAAGLLAQAEQTAVDTASEEQVDDQAEEEVMPALRWAQEDEKYDWQVDEETGREYRVDEIPLYEGGYRWLNAEKTRVRLPGGVSFDVLDYDEKAFQVKIWRPQWVDPKKAVRQRVVNEEERVANQAAVAKFYETEDHELVDTLRFEEFGKGLPRTGQWRNGFDLADMNGDGHLDIVHGPARKSNPVPNIFLHDGAGTWKRWNAQFPRNPYDYGDATTGDWNGDGHVDVAFGIHLRGLVAVVGDGKGGFKNWTQGIAVEMPGQGGDASTFSSRAIETVDWDGDGLQDILALGEGPKGMKTHAAKGGRGEELINTARSMLLYRNNGNGTWSPQNLLDEGDILAAHFGDDFDLGDLNGDGLVDLVISSRRRGAMDILAMRTKSGDLTSGVVESIRPDGTLFSSEIADLDQDGRQDLILSYISNEAGTWRTVVDFFYARGSKDQLEWERKPFHIMEGRVGVFVLQTGDVNGDGRLDLGATTGDGRLLLFLGGEDGSWKREKITELPAPSKGCQGYELRFEDLDGDSLPEILISFAGESTGIPSFPSLHNPGCKRNGSIRVWKASAL